MLTVRDFRQVDGIVHWHEDDLVVRSVGRRLEVSNDNGEHFEPWCRVPTSLSRSLACSSRLTRRLIRGNLKQVRRLNESNWIVVDRHAIWKMISGSSQVSRLATFSGKSPLRVAITGPRIIYGEYFSNQDRVPVNLWESPDEGQTWRIAHEFSAIRHIHGVFVDPGDQSIWVTTGDLDSESKIWKFDSHLSNPTVVFHGSQQVRAIDILFRSDAAYFASDAPNEVNSIYRFESGGNQTPQPVQRIMGPGFHARALRGRLVFTTCCEPSDVNTHPRAQVWISKDGERWDNPIEFEKDLWSFKFFQYGQVLLPYGSGAAGGMWATPFATENDQRSVYIPFDALA